MIKGLDVADPEQKAQLERLEQKIDAAKAATAPRPKIEEHHSQAQLAWRMVIELVVGIVIGFGMGYGLDVLFGTLPWMMIVFTLLGFAAGIKTMMRSAEEIQRQKEDALTRETGGARERTEDGD